MPRWRCCTAMAGCCRRMSVCSGAGAMSGGSRSIDDWSSGLEAIVYQRCAACGATQYFHRGFCHACGSSDLAAIRASGEGVVYAATLVCRAATPEAREHVPFKIILVDAAEGFRLM